MDKIKKTVIIGGYRCNNNCRFCIDSEKRELCKGTEEIMQEMADAKRRGRNYLELIGGEMTIREDIIDLVKFARQLGFETIAMATNGRMLSYKSFAEKILDAGITDLIFSIHGHNAQLHDSLTQSPGSFEQLMEGLNNVRAIGFKGISSNTTIVRPNYRYLRKIGVFLYENDIRNAEFIFADPTYGGVYVNFNKLMPRISAAAPYIRRCLDLAKEKEDVVHWHIRYVPLCYLRGYESQISEIQERELFHTEHIAPDYLNFDVESSRKEISRIRPKKKCAGCLSYDKCEGIWKEYIKHYGEKEISPIL